MHSLGRGLRLDIVPWLEGKTDAKLALLLSVHVRDERRRPLTKRQVATQTTNDDRFFKSGVGAIEFFSVNRGRASRGRDFRLCSYDASGSRSSAPARRAS